MGRYLNIEQSQKREERTTTGGSGGNTHLAGVSSTLFVGNLNFSTTEDSLNKVFGKIGGVVSCRVAKDQEGNSRGFGHIDFDTPENASKALKLAGTDVDGREIRVDLSQPKQNGGDRGGRGGGRGGGFGGGRGGGFGGGRGGGFGGGRGGGGFGGGRGGDRGRGGFGGGRGGGRGGFGGGRGRGGY